MFQFCYCHSLRRNSFAKKNKFPALIGIAAVAYQRVWPFRPQPNFDWFFKIEICYTKFTLIILSIKPIMKLIISFIPLYQHSYRHCCIQALWLDSFWQYIWLVCSKMFQHVYKQYLQEDIIASWSFNWIRFSCAHWLKGLLMYVYTNYPQDWIT